MNSKRKQLQQLHAKIPIECDDSEIMLQNENRDTNQSNKSNKVRLDKVCLQLEEMKSGRSDKITDKSKQSNGGESKPELFQTRRSSYFSDGKRLIDFVLAYEVKVNEYDDSESKEETSGDEQMEKRQIFENNMQALGLELEYVTSEQGNVKFILIHAPFRVLMKQAELLMIRMPVHRNDVKKEVNLMDGCINSILKKIKFLNHKESLKNRIETEEYFCQPFVAQHLHCFVNWENPDKFFSRADRARMVHDLLIRTRYDKGNRLDKMRFGIERLIRNKTYSAAYPLHEELDTSAKNVDYSTCSSDRQLLYETWVKLKNLVKYQSLDLIQKYYGTKIAFYFAWLGFYTRCLYPISILGVICVVYGLFTMSSDISSNDICYGPNGSVSQELLCPACEKFCDYIPLNSTCLYSKAAYVFDNYATIAFTVVMSIWMTVFVELWKRYHAELAYKWNVLGYEPDEEVIRPEYQYYKRAKMKINRVTKESEPYISLAEKALRIFGSAITVLFFICLVIALLFGIIVYRIIVRGVFNARENSEFIQSQAVIFTSATAALINLIFIMSMNYFYNKLAFKLTNWEYPRTQSEFDNSFTFKVFLFQFVNFYSSLFYIAFFKGRFAGIPGTPSNSSGYADPHEVKVGSIRLERCEAAGCMVELMIQLIVIMIGKQAINGFIELAYPMVCYWFRRWRLKQPETEQQKIERIKKAKEESPKGDSNICLCEKDYALNSVSQQFLFDEYLEMVIQLGFCTLFVAAFPLAPLLALINNIFEIRFDAYKFIVTMRRPVPAQARNIGVWLTIINMISNIAVLCNAFVIAFTSDFIPKMYYRMTQGTLHGYVDETLSYFDSTGLEFENSGYPKQIYCRYWDLRRPPCSLLENYNFTKFNIACADNYEFTDSWWIILAFRLAFVLVFELIVLTIKAMFAYIIPDMPTEIIKQLRRERYLMRQAVLQRRDSLELDNTTNETNSDSDILGDFDDEEEENNLNEQINNKNNLPKTNFQREAKEFDAMKRLFSKKRIPSMSTKQQNSGNLEDIEDNSSSSNPSNNNKLLNKWPSPSMLVVPPSTFEMKRPKSQNSKSSREISTTSQKNNEIEKES
ncbi:hypothetical protein ACQ4LE_003902 [Meloidogyne hapla]